MTAFEEDIHLLLEKLPKDVVTAIQAHPLSETLTEVVLDLGHVPEVRFFESKERLTALPEVTQGVLDAVIKKVGDFNTDNRAGIEKTLHRISAIRNRSGRIVGLTCRVGRAIFGTLDMIWDVVQSGQNVLFLGPPGVGKTTKLREVARVMADTFDKRVIIVDTSNEIGGDGDIPHPGVGMARRMQVPSPDRQHAVMIEAVENHMPQVIIVDEIGTEAEAQAARTIAERGVQLIATAHGKTLENLIKNPTLSDLVGGVQSVVLGDEEAKHRGTQKTVLERKALPTFEVLIELHTRDEIVIYQDVKKSVDVFLRHEKPQPERRKRVGAETIIVEKVDRPESPSDLPNSTPLPPIRLFPFGVKTTLIDQVSQEMGLPVVIASGFEDADMVVTVKSHLKEKSKLNKLLLGQTIPVHVIKANSKSSVFQFLKALKDRPVL